MTALRDERRENSAYRPIFRTFSLHGTTVRTAQAGTGPPLLLINGIGASIEMWRPLAVELAPSHRLLMVDAPGSGGSPTPTWPPTMYSLARTLVDVLDACGHDRVDVLGFSWGGVLAQQLAHDAPDRVRRLVLASTSPGLGGQPPTPLAAALMMSPLRYLSPGFLAGAAPILYGGEARRTPHHRLPQMQSWLSRPPTYRGYAYQALAIYLWAAAWHGRIHAPTLVIQGDDDPLVPPRNGRLLARRLTHARLKVVRGGGHLWLLEQPARAAAMINTFLR